MTIAERAARRAGRRRRTAGFTLIELMIVMAIIALLAALIGPQLIGQLSESRVRTTQAQIEMLATAFDAFHLDNGRYPTQAEGIEALIERPPNMPTWAGPYLRKRQIPKDSWQRDFVFEVPGAHSGMAYDLYSLGADGELGGEDENADLGNW